jgi:hypothetical protein
MVVGRLGGVGYTVDEGNRLTEILKRPFAGNRLTVALPLTGRKAGLDVLVGEKCHRVPGYPAP